MKILAYVPAYVGHGHNAGAELTMHEMMVALRSRGHNITVLISRPIDDNRPYVIDGIKVQTHGSKRDPNYMFPENDLIISHLECSERAAYICNDLKKPHVQYVHNTHITTHIALEAGSDLTVYNTKWIAEAFAGTGIVLHPAVKPDVYGGERGRSVTLVNLWRNKGVDLFYALAERNPKIEFLGVKGGYEKQDIREMSNVTILDNLADIREAYRQTKVLLMPSAYESYGRCALEAAASGIPTLSSGTLGLQEALGEAGTYLDAPQVSVPGSTPEAWTEDQFEAWDKALKKIMTPAGFGKASKAALARSQEVWSQTKTELDSFCEKVERLGA